MEEIIAKKEVPELPQKIKVQSAGSGSLSSQEITDLSEEGVQKIVEKVRTGKYGSLYLSLDEDGEGGYLMMESSPDRIFLQIWEEETETAWSCFDPAYLDSHEEAEIEPSDGQSVFELRNTMPNTPENRDLAAKCAEWYMHTSEPYPGMDWLKASF